MKRVPRVVSWLMPTRAYAIAFGAMALVGVVFCFLPLFNLLGYESAAGFGVLGGFVATGMTLHAVRRGLLAAPLSPERQTSPGADFLKLLVRHTLMLLAPALLLSLNAARVVNCAYGAGVGFWLAIAVPSILMGQLLAWVSVALFPGRRRLQIACCMLVILGSAAAVLAHLALQPPIIGHQLFLGYFSGSIYDEALRLPPSLVWYRGMNLAAAVVALALIEGLWRRRTQRSVIWVVLIGAIAAVSLIAIWVQRQDLGIGITDEYVQKELGGRLETEHFIIYFPQTTGFLDMREWLAEDHEFRYAQLKAFFDTDPARDAKIRSYVYADADQKGRLMGGRRTLVSKLWLHEMHILWGYYGDHKLTHELAHIFSEPMGAGPLRLSMQRGIGVNMGLVEGVATAADWPINEFSPHQASAALRRMDAAPDISGIVGATGFWAQSSGRAYILVGSFVRYLIDTYGIEKFKKAYPHADFAGAYQTSTDALIEEWQRFVDAIELTDEDMALAHFLYDRPSIFDKVCARELGEKVADASAAAARGDVGEVRDIYAEILGYDPQNINYRIGYARALSDARQYQDAREQVAQMLASDQAPVVRAQLLSMQGDLAWRQAQDDLVGAQEHLAQAERAYQQCLDLGVPLESRRLLQAKVEALARPQSQGREFAYQYLLGQTPDAVALYYPMRWHQADPEDALAAYLVGRRLWGMNQWAAAIPYLTQAQQNSTSSLLAEESRRMLAQSTYFLGELEDAREHFEALARSAYPSYSDEAAQWLERIAWKRGNRIETRSRYRLDHP